MKYLLLTLLLLVIGCNTSKEQMRRDAAVVLSEMTAAKAEQQAAANAVTAIEKSDKTLTLVSKHLQTVLKLTFDELSLPAKNVDRAVLANIRQEVTTAESLLREAQSDTKTNLAVIANAVELTLDRIDTSQERVDHITTKLDGVENTQSGFFTGIVSFLKKFAWWAVIIVVIVLIGGLGLWPLVMQGVINFMSSGFMLFRRPKETAKLLIEAKEAPTTDKIDNVITHFRSGTVGEAAWRHEKKQRKRETLKAPRQ